MGVEGKGLNLMTDRFLPAAAVFGRVDAAIFPDVLFIYLFILHSLTVPC